MSNSNFNHVEDNASMSYLDALNTIRQAYKKNKSILIGSAALFILMLVIAVASGSGTTAFLVCKVIGRFAFWFGVIPSAYKTYKYRKAYKELAGF